MKMSQFKKLKLPSKKSDEFIINFFFSIGVDLKDTKIIKYEKQKKIYKPILQDLYNIYQVIIKNNRTSVLEFGSGWSSIIISRALIENKKNFKKNKFKINPFFEHHILENEKKFLYYTKKKINYFLKNYKNKNVKYSFSDCFLEVVNNKFVTLYKKLPDINPDFIYLDGPDQSKIKSKKKSFKINSEKFMPMVSDILLIEYFLIPGTIIMIDGRGANAQYLKNNFTRKWGYKYFKDSDQHLFQLQAPSLGKKNENFLSYYLS
jgi:hypothetical protein